MLVEDASAHSGDRRIAVNSGSADFDLFLRHLLQSWGFEVCPPESTDTLLLAGDGVASGERQQVIRLTSSHYHGRDRLGLPLQMETLWQTLEHHYHRPPRMHIRMTIDLPAQISVRGRSVQTTLNSLSDMGARFFYPEEMVRDERVVLQLDTDAFSRRYDGCVNFSAPLGESASRGYRIGVVFHGLKRNHRDELRQYLIQTYLESIRPQMPAEVFRAGLDSFDLSAELRRILEL